MCSRNRLGTRPCPRAFVVCLHRHYGPDNTGPRGTFKSDTGTGRIRSLDCRRTLVPPLDYQGGRLPSPGPGRRSNPGPEARWRRSGPRLPSRTLRRRNACQRRRAAPGRRRAPNDDRRQPASPAAFRLHRGCSSCASDGVILLSALANTQAPICRAMLQKCVLPATCGALKCGVRCSPATRRFTFHSARRRACRTSVELASHFLFQPIALSDLRPQHARALRGVVPLVTSRNGRPDPWRCWNFR